MKDTCIWCLKPVAGSHVEHIIPEVLGCPDGFVLTARTICKRCNNELGHVDQALIDEFDFVAFMAGVPRKRGRPPVVSSRGNVRASVGRNGPEFTFNMDPTAVVAHDGRPLSGYRGRDRDVRATLTQSGQIAEISFRTTIGKSRKFVRGITKLAYSSMAFFAGAEYVRGPRFSGIRAFVRHGEGVRHTLMMGQGTPEYSNVVPAPRFTPDGEPILTFRLAGIDFLVDLSEDETVLPEVVKVMEQEHPEGGWTVLPNNSLQPTRPKRAGG